MDVLADSGTGESRDVADWKFLAMLHEFDESLIGKKIMFGGHTYKIDGASMKYKKNPILATKNGKKYRIPVEYVKFGAVSR